MTLKSIKVDSVLNKITNEDRLFLGDYTVNPYSNCDFGCIYCDSSFDRTIYVKINAAKILEKELKKNKKGRIIVGSVHDPYQNAEKKYMLTRKILEKIQENSFPCHILTKSDLVLRDIDVLKKIKDCFVTISLASIDETFSSVFEKNVLKPKQRLNVVKKLNSENIKSGVALIPFFPYFSEKNLEELVKLVKSHNALYLLFKHLELKGDQKKYFLNILNKKYPTLIKKYHEEYDVSYMPSENFLNEMSEKINYLSNKYQINTKIM
jgi:DNA repair photolyase